MNKKVLKRKIKFIGSPVKNTLMNTGYKRNRIYSNYYETKKVVDNVILYESRDGKSITDSPYAIFKYLISQPNYNEYKHVWSIQDFEDLEIVMNQYKDLDNVIFVKRNSTKYLEYLSTAKYLINNSTFQNFFIPKEDQVYINTWHGTPLKKMGFEIPGNPATSRNVVRNFLSSSILISPNEHTTNMYLKSYKLDGLYRGKIIENGYPRIDLTLNTNKSKFINKLLNTGLKIDTNKEIILYAPTWKGTNVSQARNDMKQIISDMEILKEKNGNKYNVLIKVHPFLYSTAKDFIEIKDILIPDYIDTNEMLSITDLLITDYSSIFFDYLVTDKPVLFYMWDAEYYLDSRGSYIDFEELPGPVLYNIEELTEAITNVKDAQINYQENYSAMKERFTKYDDGNVTARLVDYIFSNASESIKVIKNLDDKKEKIIFYPGGMMNNGITSSFINLMNNIDYSKYDVSVFLKIPNKQEALKNIAKINENARLLFKQGISVYSLNEIYRDRLCHNRGVEENYLKKMYPEKAYKREAKRFFGKSKFDFSIDFSGYSLFWAKFILATNANKRICYMHSDILSDSERTINKKRPHFINLRGLMTVYDRFDKLVSVSKGTMELNKKNLSNYASKEKFDFIINSINPEKILRHRMSNNHDIEKDTNINNNSISLNKKFIARARIINTEGLIIWNKPVRDKFIKEVDTADSFKDEEVVISWVTEVNDVMYYKFSIDNKIIGWLEEKAFEILPDSIISSKRVNILAILKRTKNNTIWTKPYNIFNSRKASYSGQYKNIMVDVKEIAETQHGLYSLIYINEIKIGWIDTRALNTLKDYTLINKSLKDIEKEKNRLKRRNYRIHSKVIEYLPNRSFRDRIIYKKGVIKNSESYQVWNKIPSNPNTREIEEPIEILNKEIELTQVMINKNGAFYLVKFDSKRIGWINSNAVEIIPDKNVFKEKPTFYKGKITKENYSIFKDPLTKELLTLADNEKYSNSLVSVVKETVIGEDVYCCIMEEDQVIGWISKNEIIVVEKQGIKVNNMIIEDPSPNNINFVNMSRLSPEKAQGNLILAFNEVQKRYPNSMLYILGDGPLKVELQNLVEELNLNNKVILTGQQEEPFRILDKCDCFVLSSHYEGQPMVLLEALTLSLDIIATDIIANRTVLEEGKYGILVEDSVDGLVEGLSNYIGKGHSDYSNPFDYVKYNQMAIQNFYEVIHS
ncbi:Teichoic acid biosynthesis protein [Marinilactibacillus psychrotolerans 42ea]|uniref:Teichoic acid biosynthesis protein n=1 Tax=Marinilactibacillus psychrotolerans 42ea TaxID=1255609 RepID=A0A1R4IAA7_9LACT|nr:CDP-glycerol glycerophosphotransferase family protein [Marinilactibacillus psychrotolerans]SJN16656.1 Teichoic acid biosynthesis protein [Marinilactibacillus psychrotolerans 42ea]